MKTGMTDFAVYLQSYFTDYLAGERGVSRHTIRSYRDTFVLLIEYMKDVCDIPADKLMMTDFSRDVILSFLNWLQDKKQCSVSTRNQRYAAIRSYFGYLQYKDPARLALWQSIRSIKTKNTIKTTVSYLTVEGIKCLLEQISTCSRSGRRNLALLSLLYESGARVQELIDLTPSSLRLEQPAIVYLHGKGNKKRVVPLGKQQITILKTYMEENHLTNPSRREWPLFFNNRGDKLTSSGVTFILQKYAGMARIIHPELIPKQTSPHGLRHSRAMHLLQAGVNLIHIRDIMGHISIKTTEIYARADSKQRLEALEKVSRDIIDIDIKTPSWEKDRKLKDFLKSLV
jgi:site-specific recombinase XerD